MNRFHIKQMASCCVFLLMLTACNGKQQHTTHGVVDADFIYISAEESGLIKTLLIQRGDHVKTNQILATLENHAIEHHVLSDQSELERQKQTLVDLKKPARKEHISKMTAVLHKDKLTHVYLKQRLMRIKRLFGKGFTSKDELDLAENAVKKSQSDVEATQSMLDITKLGARREQIKAQTFLVEREQHQLDSDQARLNKLTLRTTQPGIIYDVVHQEGEYVRQGEVMASLLKKDKLKLLFYVSRNDADQLQIGDLIEANCFDCHDKVPLKITYINQEAEFNPTTHYDLENSAKLVYRVEAHLIDPRPVFRPGQPVIITWKK